MTLFNRSSSKNFLAVAMAMILMGVAILVIGCIQSILSLTSDQVYGWPAAKVVGGLVVIALGYIMLQLELIRLKDK